MPHTFYRARENFNENIENDNAESDIIEGESTESESVESESTGSESIGSDHSSNSELEDPLYEEFAEALRSRNAQAAVENVLSHVKDIWSLPFNMLKMAIKYRCSNKIIAMLYETYEKERSSNDKRRIIELPFHAMATANNTSGVAFFQNDIDEENDDGENALHIAALHGSRDMVRYLIRKAPHLYKHVKGHEDATPLHYAVRIGNPRTVRTLLRYGRRPTQEEAEYMMKSLLLGKVPTEAALRILYFFTNSILRRSDEGLACPNVFFNDIGKYKADMNRARDEGRDQLVNRIEIVAGVYSEKEAIIASD